MTAVLEASLAIPSHAKKVNYGKVNKIAVINISFTNPMQRF